MRHALVLGALWVAPCVVASSVTVYVNDTVKSVTPLNGVNCGPGHLLAPLSGGSIAGQYEQMGIKHVRVHDYYGPGDLSTVFPGYWDADPGDWDSYDFSEADAVVQEIGDAGCQALYRLGQSYSNNTELRYVPPPKHSTAAWVCSRIAHHLRSVAPDTVTMWEIWNEPNLEHFWAVANPQDAAELGEQTIKEHFFNLYSNIARRLKKDHGDIVVGGPGTAGGTDKGIVDYTRDFLRACKKLGAPLDFYSWHCYNRNLEGPYVFARQAQKVREVLDEEGFADTLNILSEWNACNASYCPDPEFKKNLYTMDGAAFTAAALIYLHLYTDVSYAFRYRGDYHSGNAGYGLVRNDWRIKKPGYAFKAYSQLFYPPTYRAHTVKATGGNGKGRAVMATANASKTTVTVLISLWECSDDVTLRITDLPDSWQTATVTHYMVSDGEDYQQVSSLEGTVSSTGRITVRLEAPSGDSAIHVVRLTTQRSTHRVRPPRAPGPVGTIGGPAPFPRRPPAPDRRPGKLRKPRIMRPRR